MDNNLTGSIWTTTVYRTSNSSYRSINDLSMNSFLGISRSLLLCIKNDFILCISGLFLITFLARLVFKGSRQMDTLTRPSNLSCLHILLPLILNLGLGMAYIGLGVWIFQEEWSVGQIITPLVLFLQGLTWILLSLTMGVRSNTLPRGLLKLLSYVMILYAAGLLFVNTILTLIGGTKLSPRSILDLLSLPGSFLLLLSASKQSSSREYYGGWANDTTTCLLLNTEAERIKDDESDDQCVTTAFDGAPLLSRLTFWWLNSLMRKGRYSPLEENDVPQLGVVDKAEYCYERFSNASNQEKDKKLRSTSMFWMLVSCHSKEIMVSGLFAMLKILTLSAGPLLLNTFVKLSEGEEGFKHEGYVLAVSMFFAKVLESISQRQWYFRARLIGLQVRSTLSAAIYKKQLRLSNEGKLKHSAGEIMNYMTVDTYRIGEFPFWFHQSWTTSLQLVLALAIVFRAIGLATIAALVVIVLIVICNSPLAKLQHKFQTKLMEAQDERLKVISEALVNMKVLKLYAWETHFKKVIEGLRSVELKWLSAFQIRRAYNSFLFWTSPVLVSAATFGTCYFLKVHLEPSNVFTFVATLRLVQDPIRTIPDVIGAFIQANVALSRIVNFLEAPELENEYIKQILTKENEFSVHIKNASFSWEGVLLKPNLRNINFAARPGQKIAVCGEVGSGKSTLLAAILGEVANVHGALQVCGVIAYVSQTAWIQTGTIRENILFGSSMDGRRYKQVIESCSLAKDLEMMPYGDCTEIGERGVNLSGGQKQRIQLARAVYQDADIYLLDDPFSAVDAHTSSSLFNDCIMGALSEKTVLLVTHQTEFLPFFDSILLMSDGVILHSDTYDELLASSAEFQALVNAQKDTMSSVKLAEVVSFQANGSVSLSANKRQQYNEQNMNQPAVVDEQLIKREQRERGDSGFKPYIQYLNQNKGFLYFSLVVLSHLTFISSQILQNSWMAANVENPHVSTLKLISIYCIIGCGGAIFLLARSLFVVTLGLQSSISSFSQLLTSLFRAPMSFYDATPLGRILSRISADMGIVDLDIPFSLTFTVSSTINTYSNLGVLATITWPILFMAIPVIYCSIRLQRYYFATAKELMRINGTTKSLVANHLSESIAGAMTIRAFKQENRYFTKSLEVIDKNASPFFHNFAANEWLIERLETLSAAVLSSSALVMATLPPGTFSAGYTGMALSYGLSLNMSLVGSIRNQCTLANHIISVERINQYMHLSSEAPEVIEGSLPAPNWPDVGEVCIQNLKIKYRPDTQLVLHGISCTFQGGHKIGIVGRTGSGKSTLISALFRLVEPTDGKIFIDGVDISKVGLHDLRSRLGIIPQDPTLFLGSVRYNLDPLNKHSDHEIWEVLQKCQLHEAVQEKKDGLDSLVVEDGSNWSMGQRQLFCLGRALLRKSKILVLDEATASIDNATDAILQDTIRREFADSTVITVAHRIPTVMNCTMVLAISDGKLAEYDEPMKLMSREGSLFRELVREYFSHTNSGIFAASL